VDDAPNRQGKLENRGSPDITDRVITDSRTVRPRETIALEDALRGHAPRESMVLLVNFFDYLGVRDRCPGAMTFRNIVIRRDCRPHTLVLVFALPFTSLMPRRTT